MKVFYVLSRKEKEKDLECFVQTWRKNLHFLGDFLGDRVFSSKKCTLGHKYMLYLVDNRKDASNNGIMELRI